MRNLHLDGNVAPSRQLVVQRALEEAMVEAQSRLILAQDALSRLARHPDGLPDTLEATRLVAEATGWLANARRIAARG